MKRKRILISRPDRLGDVILSTPLPREIRKTFPEAYVAVLAREYTKDVFINNPYLNEIILFEPENKSLKYFFEKRKEIAGKKFTHALMLLPNERINYLLFSAGIPNRVGVGHKFFQFITFTRYVDRKNYIPLRHEADYCMDLARKIGVETFDIRTEIFLTEDELKRSEELRTHLGNANKKNILLHTSSGGSAPNLPVEEYIKLAELIHSSENYNLIITDKEIHPGLLKYQSLDFKINSLRDLFILLKSGDLLISSSTGPAHAAAALKIPTLTLFCPLPACSPILWSPMGNYADYILPEVNYCANLCPGDPHICDYSGEGGLNAEKVFENLAASDFLSNFRTDDN